MDTDDGIDIDGRTDGVYAGQVQGPDGSTIPVHLDDELVEQARAEGVDLDRLRSAAVPADTTVDLRAQTNGDATSTIPVQDHRRTDLTSRRDADRDFTFIQDDQIQRLIRNSVNYTERIGRFLLERDDLIPTIKERLKALITGEDGIEVRPDDPDTDADQRLADHMDDIHEDDVRPTDVIDRILRENLMNARAVLRATDLKELDLKELDYLRDGISGEEIYVQDRTTVYEFDVDDGRDDDVIDGIDLERTTVDAQPLIIGDHVFDISLYDEPPLEAVVDTAVNKMVLQRLKARKAEITAYGAVYATVEPPEYLPEDQYFDRVSDDDWDGEGQPPTKLERALENNIQNAFDTLKDFQSGTVMSVPSFWNLEQLDIPETDDPIDDQIRGYNRDISRRLLVPLDLIELQSGSELSRETMFATLMTTIAGWRREIIRVFEQFAEAEADIQGISGSVTYEFPPLKDANAKQVISALQYAGVAGLSEQEVRQMINTVQGVDLDTDRDTADMPPEGGPQDGEQRQEQMRQFIDEQRRGDDQDGSDGQPDSPSPPQPPQATAQAVRFGNVGGDPFGDEDTLSAFVDALRDAGADQVRLGNEDWGDHSGIHDRPVVADGITVDDAESVWSSFEADAYGLMGPRTAEAAEGGGSGNPNRGAGPGGRNQPPFPLADLPGVTDPWNLTRDDIARLILASYDPDLSAAWNPALHPRGPDGKFVERPYDIPSDAMAVVNDDTFDSADLLEFMADDPSSGVDVESILADDRISIDGVPDDVDSVSGLKDAISDGRAGDGTTTTTDADFRADIPDLPTGAAAHGTVEPEVVDPEHDDAAIDALFEQASRGEVELDTSWGGQGPGGLDRGMGAFVADATNSGVPTAFGNLASSGKLNSPQPHMVFEDLTDDQMDAARDAVNDRLPDGFYATATPGSESESGNDVIRVKRSGESLTRASGRMFDDMRDADVDTNDRIEVQEFAAGKDLQSEYNLPTTETRAALDRAMLTGLRDALIDDPVDRTPGAGDAVAGRIRAGTDLSGYDDGGFRDEVVQQYADWMAGYQDDTLDRWVEHFQEAGPGRSEAETLGPRAFRLQAQNRSAEVQAHEAAHGVGFAYGLQTGLRPDDDKGKPTFKWDEHAVEERSALRQSFSVKDGIFEPNEVPGLDEYVDQVEGEYARADPGDFEGVDGDSTMSAWLSNDAEEGDMIRAAEPLPDDERFGNFDPDPKQYRITNIEQQSPDTAGSQPAITVEDFGGNEYRITPGFDKVEPVDEQTFLPDITGKRDGSPDGWGAPDPDPDDHLGAMDLDGDDAAREFFESLNEAWYRQAALIRDGDEQTAEQATIGQGWYSAGNAGETQARLDEAMTGTSNHSPAAAHALVNFHPRLLEAARQMRDIPPQFAALLNDELERADADFRFES